MSLNDISAKNGESTGGGTARLSPAVGRQSLIEFLAVWLAVASVFLTSLITATKAHFWFDEFLTNMLVRDPSLPHMLRALADQVDASPPLYYIAAWGWVQVFGPQEFTLRLFTSLCMAGAFYIIWRVLQSGFGSFAALGGTVAAFMFSRVVRDEVAQTRSYGLFLLLCALAFYLWARLGEEPSKRRWIYLTANSLVHAGIVLCHNYGVLVSGSILAASVITGFLRRKFDFRVVLSVGLGWLPLLLWLPAMRNQASIGREKNWLVKPDIKDLLHGLTAGIHPELALLFLAGLLAARFLRWDRAANLPHAKPQLETQSRLMVFALALFLVPLGAFAISWVLQPVFHVRYMLPLTITYAVIFALAFSRILGPGGASRPTGSAAPPFPAGGRPQRLAGWLMIFLMISFRPAQAIYNVPSPEVPITDATFAAYKMPVAFESGTEYLHFHWYSRQPEKYFLVEDWRSALTSTNLISTIGYKIMSAIQRNYPANQIYESGDFLQQHDRFVLYDDESLAWEKCNLETNPEFTVKLLGRIGDRRLFMCERKPTVLPQ